MEKKIDPAYVCVYGIMTYKTVEEEANTICQSDKMIGMYNWKIPYKVQFSDFRGQA